MFLPKSFCFYLLLNLSSARYAQVAPKFQGKDSSVIIDTDGPLPPRMHPKLQNALYYNYPVYHLIKQQGQSTTTTTTTTEPPILTPINGSDDEFPSDLLYIAQHKLGLKRLEDVPSITELGELLGTANATETIKYIRQLTASEQGIALMKAYIETSDYTDDNNSNNASNDDVGDDDDEEDTNNEDDVVETAADSDYGNAHTKDDQTATTEAEKNTSSISSIISTTKAPQAATNPQNGFLQRLGSYINFYNLWPENPITTTTTTIAPPKIDFMASTNKQNYAPIFLPSSALAPTMLHKPLLVRNPLPYHYPIPIRPILVPGPKANAIKETTTAQQTVHLNTPKIDALPADSNILASSPAVPPHVQQLAKIANISAKKLELLLQRKPKLAELAVRVSNLPLAEPKGGAIDSQLFAAVQRAIEQDDDLKNLLSSAETLK